MKKSIAFITKVAFALTALTFFSCRDVIFETIRGEVELDDAKVSGDINSIVRYTMGGTEYLFADNGRLWRKSMDPTNKTVIKINSDGTKTEEKGPSTNNPTDAAPYGGKWYEFSKKGIADDAHVIHLAADETVLYALTGVLKKDSDTGYNVVTKKTLYYHTSDENDEWQEVTFYNSEGERDTTVIAPKLAAQLYCTNSIQKAHRRAYLCLENSTIYKLEAGAAKQLKGTGSATGVLDYPSTNCVSCAWIETSFNTGAEDKVYFSSYAAMITDETSTSEASVMCYGNGSDVYSIKNDIENKFKDCSDPTQAALWNKSISLSTIYALAYTADHLVAGTKEGLLYATLENDVPKTKVTLANTSSTLSSYYRVQNVIAADPAFSATAGDLYAPTIIYGSTTSTGANVKNVGLWSYYPGRNKWNRE